MSTQRSEKQMLNRVCYGLLVSGVCSQALGPLIPFFRESYGFGYDVAGMFLSIHSLGNLTAVILAGILPAYIGRRKSILSISVWMGVSYFMLAAGVNSAALVMLAGLLSGIARGGNSTFVNTAISTLPGDMPIKGYNRGHGSYALGGLLAPLLLLLVVYFGLHWRVMAGVLCIFAVSQFCLYAKMPLPDEPKSGGVRRIDYRFLKDKRFWMGASMLFCYISTEYAISGWLVTYFQDMGILDPDSSQLMNTLFWATIFIGRMVGSQIVGKISPRRLLTIDAVGMVACFLVMFFSRSALPATLGLAGVGIFMATVYPTAFSFGSNCIKGNDFGCSLMSFIASIGGIITPALVGFVANTAGIMAGMTVVACVVVLQLITVQISIFATRTPKKI